MKKRKKELIDKKKESVNRHEKTRRKRKEGLIDKERNETQKDRVNGHEKKQKKEKRS